ncbi:MAG: adenosylmethionine--8-amino-7-oxononanoate transaminase [Candidatus Pelagadaptatus aseana]|uniref:adenosylmethionine--8-amino-7-oxononanoate transaminase n=1 Tax=Candidatus Pelagadaptatus aseana TaxID=3120508 RepID=UPI0039B30760
MLTGDQILALDQQHIWHPYASLIDGPPVYPVASAEGARFTLSDGRQLIDGMSSWWCMIHGYNHPELNQAIKLQLEQMSHIMFGGLTHQPAAELAKLLADITPKGLDKVFFADSGSVAVEVALKMALQYWHSQGQPQKNKILALQQGYHGDTIGAMSVCDPVTGMHHLFQHNLMQNLFAPAPTPAYDEPFAPSDIAEFTTLIKDNHQQLAAVILEPIVQGAGGMRFYSPQYLKQVHQLCQQYDVLLIADEIATGFGRTGKLFACEHADISPDILCLGKALTGGYMTLSATLCNEKISNGICRGEAGVFMHGPTFMGNPLATATALASTRLLLSQDWQANVQRIESLLNTGLAPCRDFEHVADVRVLGAIGVVEMNTPVNMAEIQSAFIAQGVWVRPFGKLVYLMPPLVISDAELKQLTGAMCRVIADKSLFSHD